ncbi:MAG: hypothetical protein WC452_09190 [Aminobacteriaceae bacterium]|jgi:hypothetical protein|nr:hypothetical protein [Synergistaceae bacterium]MDD4021929.1 hypothetical protein [Synergistaceae bacterium]MDD4613100.1 hypothetical protein [Synergistaceae bacterium]
MEDEKIHFDEEDFLAAEIAKRERDFLPDEEDELLTPEELEKMKKGE